MTTTLGSDQRQDQDIGDCHQSGWVRFDPDDDTAQGERELLDFDSALFDLQKEREAARQGQLEGTVNLLAGKPEDQGRPLADIRAEAERAVAADQRRVLAFELPELVHETPDQLTQAMQARDEELKQWLEAALDLAAQAPPSFRRFRAVTAQTLEAAQSNQTAIATQQGTAIRAQRSAQQSSGLAWGRRGARRQVARLGRVQQSTVEEAQANLQRIRYLQARLDVIDAAAAWRQAWAAEDVGRAAVLALGVAAAEALLERRVAPRLARFAGTTDPEAPTEPFPVLVLVPSGEEG